VVEDTHKSNNDTQYNAQQKERQRDTNYLQSNTKKTNYPATLKTGDELRCSGRLSSSCSRCDTRRVTLVPNPVTCHEKWIELR